MKKINQTSLFLLGSLLCFLVGKFTFLENCFAQSDEKQVNNEINFLNKESSKKENENKGKSTTIKSQSKLKGTQPTTICIK